MAASFLNASSQRLVLANPPVVSTIYPFSFGMWVNPTSTTSRAVLSLASNAAANQFITVLVATTWGVSAQAGGVVSTVTTGTVTINKWAYMVVRLLSATLRRIDVLQFDGSIASTTTATSRAPTGINTMSLGSAETSAPGSFFDGLIGEFFYTATDIQADGAALQSRTLRQIAYGGPFSVPHIAKDIIEYRSLREHPLKGERDDVYTGAGKSIQPWSNTGGVTIGPHPPLPYWFAKPTQTRKALVPI